MPITRALLSKVDAFRHLGAEDLAAIEARLAVESVARGEALLRQGEPAKDLYIVASGRFHVWREGEPEPIAEIGAGSPIGEIGFFAGGVRTATALAERDSLVLRLSRQDFDDIAARNPQLWSSIVATLAQRLARTTAGTERTMRRPRPRTVCLLPATRGGLDGGFRAALIAEFERLHPANGGGGDRRNVLVLDATAARTALNGRPSVDDENATTWFNDVEARHDLVILIAEAGNDDWSRKAVRQADLVLCVADSADRSVATEPTALERFAGGVHRARALWLVLLRPRDTEPSGTRAWIDARSWIGQHHHVRPGDAGDIARLARFVSGRAFGLVACGGGAFCPSHIGVYEALGEAGVVIDAFGGTSGGAAMAAAFAGGLSADEISEATEDIFVRRRAMRRWTLPRYSLLDHTVLEAALKEHYTDIDIADLPLPFFAVSTNLSRHEPVIHRSGPLWEAIRASSAIPALLPPVITRAGDMLVDGCLVDNVPVAAMHDLKLGPNIVVDFLVPTLDRIERPDCDLPQRGELAWRSLTAAGRRRLPAGPSPQEVLMRGLMLNASEVRRRLAPGDLLIEVPMPDSASHLDWHLHAELRRLAHAFTREALAGFAAEGRLGPASP